MPQRPSFRVNHVVVRGINHNVVVPRLPATGSPAEPKHTIGQLLSVHFPAGVAPPASVDGVGDKAWSFVLSQCPPRTIAASCSPFPTYKTYNQFVMMGKIFSSINVI